MPTSIKTDCVTSVCVFSFFPTHPSKSENINAVICHICSVGSSLSLSLSLSHISTQMPLNCTLGKRGKKCAKQPDNELYLRQPDADAADSLSSFCHRVSLFLFWWRQYNKWCNVLQIYYMNTSQMCCTHSKNVESFLFTFLVFYLVHLTICVPFNLISYVMC